MEMHTIFLGGEMKISAIYQKGMKTYCYKMCCSEGKFSIWADKQQPQQQQQPEQQLQKAKFVFNCHIFAGSTHCTASITFYYMPSQRVQRKSNSSIFLCKETQRDKEEEQTNISALFVENYFIWNTLRASSARDQHTKISITIKIFHMRVCVYVLWLWNCFASNCILEYIHISIANVLCKTGMLTQALHGVNGKRIHTALSIHIEYICDFAFILRSPTFLQVEQQISQIPILIH